MAAQDSKALQDAKIRLEHAETMRDSATERLHLATEAWNHALANLQAAREQHDDIDGERSLEDAARSIRRAGKRVGAVMRVIEAAEWQIAHWRKVMDALENKT